MAISNLYNDIQKGVFLSYEYDELIKQVENNKHIAYKDSLINEINWMKDYNRKVHENMFAKKYHPLLKEDYNKFIKLLDIIHDAINYEQ